MKEKLEKLIETLRAATAGGRAALWISGGKDSLLILHVLLSEKLPFDLLRFEDGWTKDQKRHFGAVIDRFQIPVYSYLPRSVVLFGDGDEEISLACAYIVGDRGEQVTLLKDFVPGKRCALDLNIEFSNRETAPLQFNTHIWGTKKGESHYSFGGEAFTSSTDWSVGSAHFVAPLFEWTDAEVVEALKTFGVDYRQPAEDLDGGNLPACTNCLQYGGGEALCPKTEKLIPVLNWRPTEKLEEWRKLNRG